jgi:hypothetical protein
VTATSCAGITADVLLAQLKDIDRDCRPGYAEELTEGGSEISAGGDGVEFGVRLRWRSDWVGDSD